MKNKKVWIIVLSVLFIITLAGAGYAYFKNREYKFLGYESWNYGTDIVEGNSLTKTIPGILYDIYYLPEEKKIYTTLELWDAENNEVHYKDNISWDLETWAKESPELINIEAPTLIQMNLNFEKDKILSNEYKFVNWQILQKDSLFTSEDLEHFKESIYETFLAEGKQIYRFDLELDKESECLDLKLYSAFQPMQALGLLNYSNDNSNQENVEKLLNTDDHIYALNADKNHYTDWDAQACYNAYVLQSSYDVDASEYCIIDMLKEDLTKSSADPEAEAFIQSFITPKLENIRKYIKSTYEYRHIRKIGYLPRDVYGAYKLGLISTEEYNDLYNKISSRISDVWSIHTSIDVSTLLTYAASVSIAENSTDLANQVIKSFQSNPLELSSMDYIDLNSYIALLEIAENSDMQMYLEKLLTFYWNSDFKALCEDRYCETEYNMNIIKYLTQANENED